MKGAHETKIRLGSGGTACQIALRQPSLGDAARITNVLRYFPYPTGSGSEGMASRPMDLHQPVRIMGYSYVISDLFSRRREEELHFALRGSFCGVCEGLFLEMNIALVEAAER